MAKKRYAMVIEEEKDAKGTQYGAWFPDLPGCFTAGDSLEHLHRMAEEAVSLYLWAMNKGHEPLPEPKHQVSYVSVDPVKAIAEGGSDARQSVSSRPARRRSAAAAKSAHVARQLVVGRTAARRGKAVARA